MKNNKVNIDLIVPSVGQKYNLFIPINKTIGEVIVILNKTINEMTGCFPINDSLSLLNVMDCIIYDYKAEIKDTDIKNGSVLALI